MDNKFLETTYYCNHQHPSIHSLSRELVKNTENELQFIKKAFHYIRDEIRFGGDIWKVRASETLQKKFGPCYGKNVLFMAILRNKGIPCHLAANPMCRTFAKPNAGSAHIFFSNPFIHCFTKVKCNDQWIHLDPTLDKDNYDVFFKPMGVNWNICWDSNGMAPLYNESIIGTSLVFDDIDTALKS
ncbi:MAG: transglutaminase family protein, partial [Proteobacteria bacterium]|nr:transglutaminase family protein [Pseudomonadota bacterium]